MKRLRPGASSASHTLDRPARAPALETVAARVDACCRNEGATDVRRARDPHDRRRVLVTPQGQEVIGRARLLLRQADDVELSARSAADPFVGTIRIGIIPTVSHAFCDSCDRIRLSGEGEAGVNGGPPGDLYVVVHLKEHSVFQRDGDDLHCEMPISFSQAALGGEIEIPTLDGKAAIDIPEGTQAGKQFRLRGKGIKGVRSSVAGDLYCHIAVETPVKLTEHQRKLLKELDESLKKGGAKHSPNEESWADKLKGFFSA